MSRNSEWMNSALVGRDGFCRTVFAPELFAQDYYGLFDHFMLSKLTSTTAMGGFTVTVLTDTDAGTLVMTSGAAGGVLGLVGATHAGAGIECQNIVANFLPAANKDIFFEARMKLSTANVPNWFLGLAALDTSIIASVPDNVIMFTGVNGDAHIRLQVRAAGTGAAAVTGTDLVDNTWMRLGLWIQSTKVIPYLNGVAGTAVTTNIPSAALSLSFGMNNGDTTPRTMSLDWYRVMQFV
jgi:hypothetical protein